MIVDNTENEIRTAAIFPVWDSLSRGEPFPSIMYSGRWEEKHL